MHVVRPQDDGIRMSDFRGNLVTVARKSSQSFDGNIIQCQNLVHDGGMVFFLRLAIVALEFSHELDQRIDTLFGDSIVYGCTHTTD